MKKDGYITITTESYNQMNGLLIERAKQIERLQEQLKDAEYILDEMCWVDMGLIDDYFKKRGVK